MEQLLSSVKRKIRLSDSSSSSQETSPAEKRLKDISRVCADEDEVMAAEGLAGKIDLILSKLEKLDTLETKLEEVFSTINSLKASVTSLEEEISAVKEKQRSSDKKIKDLKENAEFVSGQVEDLNSTAQEEKETRCKEIKEVRKELLYLETYSRRENLKFDGIPEHLVENEQGRRMEDTKGQLVDFLENVLEVENANDIEFQRVHRLGKQPRSNSSGRTIIARFLRYSDREKVLRCGYKLKDTDYKIYEDIPKELYDLRKIQMKKLKEARKEGKKAFFSKSEPDKLFIDGKYVKM
ncbi:uncharacterized protein LOC144663166 [Oculina patagonica]